MKKSIRKHTAACAVTVLVMEYLKEDELKNGKY